MASTKQDSLNAIDEAWDELQRALTGVPPEHIDDSGVAGDWSVKDIVGHVTTWERELIARLEGYMATGDEEPLKYSSYESIDEFNEISVQENKARPVHELTDDLEATHVHLVALLGRTPEEAFKTADLEKRVREDSFKHYREHAETILKWLDDAQTRKSGSSAD